MKKTLAIILTAMALCFAQDASEKLAVYVSGASDAGINKSLSSKLLTVLAQSGNYTEITDPGSFQGDLTKVGKSDAAQITQIAKKHGADYVCVVNMIEAFGAYSISARLIKVNGFQIVKTGLADRSIKSLEDLNAVSNELAKQLVMSSSPTTAQPEPAPVQPAPVAVQVPIQPPVQPLVPPLVQHIPSMPSVPSVPSVPSMPPAMAATAQQYYAQQQQQIQAAVPQQYYAPQQQQVQPAIPQQYYAPPQQQQVQPAPFAMAASQKQCAKTFNVNEIIFKLKGFPNQLKDCSQKLAKDMALAAAPVPGFLKKSSAPTEKIEPKSYIRRCSVDGIKKEMPEGFPNVDRLLGSVDNFVQKVMSFASSANGELDPTKLLNMANNMNIDGLLAEVKGMLANAECMVDEVYSPIAQTVQTFDYRSAESAAANPEPEKSASILSFGIRAGVNLSQIYAEYSNKTGAYSRKVGMQLGMLLDIAISEIFHIQPGIMYVKKGTSGYKTSEYNDFYSSNGKEYDIAAHYIDIPALASLKLGVFRLSAGPYLGGFLGADNEDANVFGKDLGFSIGAGFDIDMFYVGAFYDHGFTDMSSKSGASFFNRTIGLNTGINL